MKLVVADNVLEALKTECPECGAPSGEDCYGISGVVVNARIISKGDGSAVGFFVVHDERILVQPPLKLVQP